VLQKPPNFTGKDKGKAVSLSPPLGAGYALAKILIKLLPLLFFLLTSCATPKPPSPERPEAPPEVLPVEKPLEKPKPAEQLSPEPKDAVPEKAEPENPIKKPETDPVVIDPISLPESPPINPEDLYLRRLQTFPSSGVTKELPFRIFPQDALLQEAEGDNLVELKAVSRDNDTTVYTLNTEAVLITAPGYTPAVINLARYPDLVETKLEPDSGPLVRIGEIITNHQPKSVRFSPDGKSVFVANLGDFTALTQFQISPLSRIRNFEVPNEYRRDSGFVETLILPGRGEIWLSQMNRNIIHIFDINSAEYLAGIELSGVWPKILLSSPDERNVYISCWDSETVIEIDTRSRQEIRSFKTSGTPRGLALSPDGESLLAAIFSSSGVDRIDLESGNLIATYEASPGRNIAMRHIVFDKIRREYYITAMGARRVYRLSENAEWMGWWDVGDKPNTCEISPDGSRLFVSCRGPNNPDTGYLHKGYEFGKIYIINLTSGTVEGWIWGRDQPTGLDVSPDGRYLAFSDFLSHRLELYRITEVSRPTARGGR